MRRTYTLKDIAPAVAATESKNDGEVWLLNLEHVESYTGRLLEKKKVPTGAVGSSTQAFDASNVLYSKLRPYLNKVYLPEGFGYCTSEFVPLRPRIDLVTRDYLAAYLRSERFLSWIKYQVAGSKMPRVSMEAFWDHLVELPSLEEQERITQILNKAESVRHKRQQAVREADSFMRAIFLDMFGDPVTNPMAWPIRKFGELGQWASGGTPDRARSDFFRGEIPWFSAGELNAMYVSESSERITDLALTRSSAKLFAQGSLLLGMYDTAALKASILEVPASSNQACANFQPGPAVIVEWFYYFIQLSKDHFLLRRRGVRQKNLNLGMIRAFDLPLPPVSLQEAFLGIVRQVRKIHAGGSAAESLCKDLAESLRNKFFGAQS